MNWNQLTVLAGEQPAGNPPGGVESIWPLLLPFAVVFLLYQFLIARPQRRDQAKRDEMLKQLKKNDPVVTIGGIIATVANMSDDGLEVTLKVDDNTRLRVRRDAIREVVVKTPPAAATAAAPAK
jgi:preprotein translocase subunit YajC